MMNIMHVTMLGGVVIPNDILALLSDTHYPEGPVRNRWLAGYQRHKVFCRVSTERFEHSIFALLSLGIEPTVALAAYHEVCSRHDEVAKGEPAYAPWLEYSESGESGYFRTMHSRRNMPETTHAEGTWSAKDCGLCAKMVPAGNEA